MNVTDPEGGSFESASEARNERALNKPRKIGLAEETATKGSFETQGPVANVRVGDIENDAFYSFGRNAEEPFAPIEQDLSIAGDDMPWAEVKGIQTRGPKLWHVSFSDLYLDPFSIAAKVLEDTLAAFQSAYPVESGFAGIISSITDALTRNSSAPGSQASGFAALFTPLQAVIDGLQDSIDTIINNSAPISSTLSGFFSANQTSPRDGDYVYTSDFGIVYVIFKQHVSAESGSTIPTGSAVFRVEFSADSETYVALTTFPAPDVGRLLTTLINYIVDFLKSVLSAGLSALLTGIVNGILSGLNALFDELQALIDALQALIDDIFGLINALQDQIDALQDQIDALQALIDALQALIDGAVDVTVVGADGNYQTIKVIESTTGASAEREITWIDSSTGYGRKGSFLIKTGAAAPIQNTVDVDWRKVRYIDPDGTTYQMHCLVRIANTVSTFTGYLGTEPIDNQTSNNYAIKEIILVGEDNTPADARGLYIDGHGSVESENGTDPPYFTPS